MAVSSQFAFALCNPGSERALKAEAMALGWKPSYQKRGFVTFKAGEGDFDLASLEAGIACARRLCLSLGKYANMSDAEVALNQCGVQSIHQLKFEDHRIRPQGGDESNFGELVGTVVELAEGEVWAGVHKQCDLISRHPGGDSGLEMPESSPSRAWLKLEEAVRFFGLDFRAGEVAVELGASPGGVVHALLNRGVSVIGVDPAKMADVVLEYAVADRASAPQRGAWFYHCRKPAALVGKRDLGQGVSWFLSDMNQSPDVVLTECRRFLKMAPEIRGVLITLKLKKIEEIADKQHWLDALASMGFTICRVQQLAVHHREFALLGLKSRPGDSK